MSALILALLEELVNGYQVKTCLEECGHEVFVADSFVKASGILGTQDIDLIISDVHLENGGSVFDFLREVKTAQRTSQIPFILFSFRPTPRAKFLGDALSTASRQMGAAKYIQMDTFNAAEFQAEINSVLRPETREQTPNDDRQKR
jgi:DNA-binding response OmpR family regulator